MIMDEMYQYSLQERGNLTCSNLNECTTFSAIVSVVIVLRVRQQDLIFVLMLHVWIDCTKINISKTKGCYLIS